MKYLNWVLAVGMALLLASCGETPTKKLDAKTDSAVEQSQDTNKINQAAHDINKAGTSDSTSKPATSNSPTHPTP